MNGLKSKINAIALELKKRVQLAGLGLKVETRQLDREKKVISTQI
jgi:hypothetical protein